MQSEKLEIRKQLTRSRINREHFKTLRANIDFDENAPKVIMFTSSIPEEGKSTLSLNLASEIAGNGFRVLYADCDLRKSQHGRNYKLKNASGMAEVLTNKEKVADVLWETDVPGLFMILSGHFPDNPSELLGRSKVGRVIESCRNAFDYVIIDAPPLGSVIDAALIAKHTDGVIFVVGSDMVSTRLAQKCIQQVERAGGKILGCVVNKLKFSNRSIYGSYGINKYYYENYRFYYGEDGERE